jgi:TPR repeat protein
MIRMLAIGLLSLFLMSCASMHTSTTHSLRATSELEQGQRYFKDGYYRKALHVLLPLACDGVPEAQYAVGYLYYYGFGVGQDTDTGYFWIKRSADKGYQPAIVAMQTMEKDKGL